MRKYSANINLIQSIILIVLIFMSSVCFSQKIENVRPEVAGEKINIYYDLIGIEDGQSVFVKAYISTDGGKTYGEPLKSVTGDVGMVIGPGKNKCIVWDVFNEMDELVSLNVKFKVQADLVQAEQIIQPLVRQYKLNLNTNLGSKRYFDSKSFGFNLKGTVYLKQLGLGVRGDYFRTFRKNINYTGSNSITYPDTGYYWGYAGGAVVEYDLLKSNRYSLYPFVCIGSTKMLYSYNSEYKEYKNYTKDEYFVYSIFGSAGLGFDMNIIKFLYLGIELEYCLSPWLDIVPSAEPDEGLDGLSIGFVIKFVINPG
jgi:hypothetical protein